MNIKHKVCTLVFLLLTIIFSSANAANNLLTRSKPPTAEAFYLDTQVWLKTTIPVCWENLAAVSLQNRTLTQQALRESWEASSAIRFVGFDGIKNTPTWGQCPIGFFPGVRVNVDENAFPSVFPIGNKLLGYKRNKTLGYPNGVILNFTQQIGLPSIRSKCFAKNYNATSCIKSEVIHEFGHVLGISHEQNRTDDPNFGLCAMDDDSIFNPYRTQGKLVIGNIRISNFDQDSIMNYCNPQYPGIRVLSLIDKIAAQIYYGNMPSWNTPVGFNYHVGNGIQTIRIPSLKIGTTYYSATLSASTDANRDGIYDNVFTLVKTAIPGNVNISSYPVTVANGVINIIMAKRTVSSPLYPYPFGKVYYLGRWEFKAIPGTTDKWYATSNYGNYNTQYPIYPSR